MSEDAMRIAGEVADALSYAHGRGVIHRDIKPENILREDGRALAKTPADRFATIQGWRDALMRPSPDAANGQSGSGLGFSPSDRASIAILPFKSLGSDPDQEFLADGIRFGIQATLVQLSGLFLVNASTLNTYRGKDVSVASVGDELGVRYILEGAVQQAGQRIRVTVQLTDVDARRTIWAERYDRLVEDVFKLQDEITGEVISALHVKLLSGELARGWFATLTSPEAREYYYRGASHLYEGNMENNAAPGRCSQNCTAFNQTLSRVPAISR